MAATFRPVNPPVAIDAKTDEPMATSPTTPTPTKTTFGQRPLPNSPFPQTVQIPERIDETQSPPQQENSRRSRKSSADVDMDESDDDGAGSDSEIINPDGTRSSKKKKSQRFYCTDYPPCNLSFTRSEHLARHIRKHTGERPFQCHCSRRFSRLDNLRQHAQTVHVNEDIPIDSLAATGTRFQRQIRTDRVRTAAGRARASTTAGGMGVPSRGHGKSLSTSSISSVGSTFSARDDMRRRPPPLVMADPRSRLSMEAYQRSPREGAHPYRPVSPSEFSTPTSATFSTGQSSPRWGSSIASPTSSHSRSHSMYVSSRTPARRLSVPSGGVPFHSPHGTPLGRPLFGPGQGSTSAAGPYSPISSVMASPTSSVYSRRESISSNADEAWRRRTWHPDSSNFGNPSSRLSNVYTPSQFQSPVDGGTPAVNHPPPQAVSLRLPGIESFDPVPHRPTSPPRRVPSPMMVDTDTSHPAPLLPAADISAEGRRNTANWDMGLHRGLTRLDLGTNRTPPRESATTWAQEASQAVEAEAERARQNPPTVRFNEPVMVHDALPARSNSPPRSFHQHTMSAPVLHRPRESKRRGWFQNPVQVHTEGPPEKIARVDRMVHPNISQFPGFPAREAPPAPHPTTMDTSEDRDNMLRLQALVAVATSEGNATAAY